GNYFTGIAHQWAVVCAEQISLVKIAAIAFSDPLGWRRTERLFLFKVAGKASINGKRFRVSIAASTHDTRTGAGHWPEPGFWEMMTKVLDRLSNSMIRKRKNETVRR